jgi:hypothetical protein
LLDNGKTLEHFYKYLYGQEFQLRTDHSDLTWLLSFKNLEEQSTHWVCRFQEYSNAYVFLRRPCPEICTHFQKVKQQPGSLELRVIAATALHSWGHIALMREQLDGNDMGPILPAVEAGEHPTWKNIC